MRRTSAVLLSVLAVLCTATAAPTAELSIATPANLFEKKEAAEGSSANEIKPVVVSLGTVPVHNDYAWHKTHEIELYNNDAHSVPIEWDPSSTVILKPVRCRSAIQYEWTQYDHIKAPGLDKLAGKVRFSTSTIFTDDDGITGKCILQLPQCRVEVVDTIYTIDIVKYTGELIVSGDMSTDTRCFYDRLLDIPHSGLSNNFTSDRNGLFGRVERWFHHFTEYDLNSGLHLEIDLGTITLSMPQSAEFSIYNKNPVEVDIAITKSKLSSGTTNNSSTRPAAAINFSVVDTISLPEQQQFAPTLMQRSDYRCAALLVNGPQRLANFIEVPKNDPYYSIMFSNLANAELETNMKLKPLKVSHILDSLAITLDKDRTVVYEKHAVPAASKLVLQVAVHDFPYQSPVARRTKEQYITTNDLDSFEVLNMAVFAGKESFIPIRLQFRTVTGDMCFTTSSVVNYGDVYAGMKKAAVKLFMKSSLTVSASIDALVISDYTSKHTALSAKVSNSTIKQNAVSFPLKTSDFIAGVRPLTSA
jgi:hypothetical protein